MVQFHSSMKIDGLGKTLLPVSTGAMHLQAHISFCYFLTTDLGAVSDSTTEGHPVG